MKRKQFSVISCVSYQQTRAWGLVMVMVMMMVIVMMMEMMMLILTMKVLALECGIDLAEEHLHLTDEMTSAWLARNIVTS